VLYWIQSPITTDGSDMKIYLLGCGYPRGKWHEES